MCGRFSLAVQARELQLELGIETVSAGFEPQEVCVPGRGITVITNDQPNELNTFYWGLIPSWAKDIKIARSTFNARCETVQEKPSFRNAFCRRRCLIPATQYMEWMRSDEGKTPFIISVYDAKVFTLAGLWEYWMDDHGNEVYSATIITCPANPELSKIHDRMPVILSPENRWNWLSARDYDFHQKLLKPYSADALQIRQLRKE